MLSKMSFLVGVSDSSEAGDLLGLEVKTRADKVEFQILVIAATDPKLCPQNKDKRTASQCPVAQPHPMLMIIYGPMKTR